MPLLWEPQFEVGPGLKPKATTSCPRWAGRSQPRELTTSLPQMLLHGIPLRVYHIHPFIKRLLRGFFFF